MQIRLTYSFSLLDNEHQFGIEFIDDQPYHNLYIRWVFFYLGMYLEKKKIPIYPYSIGIKTFKQYKNCNDAKRQAMLIVNAINKKLKSVK